jgi:small multidrug resistance pump
MSTMSSASSATNSSAMLAALPLTSPTWMKRVLQIAGVYNLIWGAWVVLAPLSLFKLLGVSEAQWPNATGQAIWQCVGMVIGVYGIGYLCAAIAPMRHWPIVLVGLLGKLFGPIGFVDAALVRKTFPTEFGWTIITNDLIWWIPFTMILLAAYKSRNARTGELT